MIVREIQDELRDIHERQQALYERERELRLEILADVAGDLVEIASRWDLTAAERADLATWDPIRDWANPNRVKQILTEVANRITDLLFYSLRDRA